MKRTGTLPPAGDVKLNLEVMPSCLTQRKMRFVASSKTKALKASPRESKVHFLPHFYEKPFVSNYRIKYLKIICMEFAIKLLSL